MMSRCLSGKLSTWEWMLALAMRWKLAYPSECAKALGLPTEWG